MSDLKTQPTSIDVKQFLSQIENERRKEDAHTLLAMFTEITKEPAVMWGPSIIGFGTYQYTTADGKEHKFMRSGFSPRKQNLTLYVGALMSEKPDLLDGLGKHKTSKSCLYINKLIDVNLEHLGQIIRADLHVMNDRYPEID